MPLINIVMIWNNSCCLLFSWKIRNLWNHTLITKKLFLRWILHQKAFFIYFTWNDDSCGVLKCQTDTYFNDLFIFLQVFVQLSLYVKKLWINNLRRHMFAFNAMNYKTNKGCSIIKDPTTTTNYLLQLQQQYTAQKQMVKTIFCIDN